MWKKGDGVARMFDYIIYVPGTSKGSRVNVKVAKITGKVAYGNVSVDQA